MSYRKITVDGKQYKYVTGKTHTKIHGIGAFKNEDIGSYVWVPKSICDDPKCRCEPFEEVLKLSVSPRNVAMLIEYHNAGKKVEDYFPLFRPHNGCKIGDVREIH